MLPGPFAVQTKDNRNTLQASEMTCPPGQQTEQLVPIGSRHGSGRQIQSKQRQTGL